MTKAELIVKMCGVCGESKATTERVLDGLCGVIETELKNGGAVKLPGIGKLFSKMGKARECRTPPHGRDCNGSRTAAGGLCRGQEPQGHPARRIAPKRNRHARLAALCGPRGRCGLRFTENLSQ